jgi:hypothetical protein
MSDDASLKDLKATVAAMQAEMARLKQDLAHQQDIESIRALHFKYGYFIDQCRYDEAVDLFAEDGIAYFHNGIYKGKEGVRRLYAGWFREMFTRGVNGPIEGFLLDHFMGQEIVDVAPDGLTGWLRGRCLMQAGYHCSVETLGRGLAAKLLGRRHPREHLREGRRCLEDQGPQLQHALAGRLRQGMGCQLGAPAAHRDDLAGRPQRPR